ncbi:MAG: FG-GAP repeat domain-containing protein, partial [Myxococcota bacterium]
TLVVLRGDGGSEVWSSPGWNGGGGIAMADVDGDGITDIVGFGADGTVRAVDATGRVLWSGGRVTTTYPQATVADLDGDGNPEVIADTQVLNGSTGALLFTLPINASIPYRLPAVADLDQNGTQEIILGNSVFSSTGQLMWTSPVRGSYGHWAAVLDTDGDPQAEVAMVGGGQLAIHDHDGTQKVLTSAGGTQPGAPCVADFDGDGQAEIAWGSSSTLNMYETDGRQRWGASVDDSSGLASCSGYDIDGDGAYEVLFADQNTFHIFDGTTGVLLYSQGGHASGTLWEYPSVADLDNDGSAEIVITSNNYYLGGWSGVTVFGHNGDGWMKSGNTWHTHDYAVTNILADGSVPARPEPWWQTYNVYRARPAVDSAATDLQVRITDVCYVGCEDDNLVQVAVQVLNTGGVDVPAGVPVSIYGNSGGVYTLIGTQTLAEPVPSGRALESIEVNFRKDQVGTDGFLIRVDDDGSGTGPHVECDEANNEATYNDPPC